MLQMLAKYNNKQEDRESKDEVLIGEMVFAMAHLGCPTIGFQAGTDRQYTKFKPADDAVLNSVTILLDRKTGDSALQQAVLGSKATLHFVGEVKNHLADPDDLVHMFKADLGNLFKNPWLGDVKLDHQLNSVTGTKSMAIDIDSYIGMDQNSRQQLNQLLHGTIHELRESLRKYKK